MKRIKFYLYFGIVARFHKTENQEQKKLKKENGKNVQTQSCISNAAFSSQPSAMLVPSLPSHRIIRGTKPPTTNCLHGAILSAQFPRKFVLCFTHFHQRTQGKRILELEYFTKDEKKNLIKKRPFKLNSSINPFTHIFCIFENKLCTVSPFRLFDCIAFIS